MGGVGPLRLNANSVSPTTKMRGHLRLKSDDPHGDSLRYVRELAARLRAMRPGPLDATDLSVAVHVDWIRLSFTWFHLFKGVNSAEFRAVPGEREFRIDYDVRSPTVIWSFAAFAIVVFLFSLGFPPSLWNLAGPPIFVALVLALNLIVTNLRVRAFLREVGKYSRGTESSSSGVLTRRCS